MLAKCRYCSFAVLTSHADHFFHVYRREAHKYRQYFCTNIKGFPSTQFSLPFSSQAKKCPLALRDFCPKKIVTHSSLFSKAILPRSTSRPLPDTSSLSPSQYASLQSFSTEHTRTLPATPHLASLHNKPSEPFLLLRSSFSFSSHYFSYLSSLPALTSASHNILSTLSPSSCSKLMATRTPTFCHRRTHIRPDLPLVSKLPKQLSWRPLFSFAYKYVLKPQAQTYSTFITQISNSTLSHYATQLTHIPLRLHFLMGRAPHLPTAI